MNEFAATLIGKTFGGYRVLELIGEGGMAVVVSAENILNPHIKRALKVIKPEYAQRARFYERFSREALVLDRLESQYIVKFHGLKVVEDLLYMELELLEGYSLDQPHAQSSLSNLSSLQVAQWLYEAATGLSKAHQSEIIHRDIKPANLFIHYSSSEPHGTVKLLDFGIAKVLNELDAERHSTLEGHVLGSPAFMAPEVCVGSASTVTSDVYSLSLIGYQLLLGRHPFLENPDSMNTMQVMLSHLRTELPSLTDQTLETPQLEEILAKGAAREPEHRYTDGGEFAEALSLVIEEYHSFSAPSAESRLLNPTPHEERSLNDLSPEELSAELFGDSALDRAPLYGPLIALSLFFIAIVSINYEWRSPSASPYSQRAYSPNSSPLIAPLGRDSLPTTTHHPNMMVSQRGSSEVKRPTRPSNSQGSASHHLESLNISWIAIPDVDHEERSISKSEVTVAQYRACVQSGGCTQMPVDFKPTYGVCTYHLAETGLPINCVTYEEAEQFAEWLNELYISVNKGRDADKSFQDRVSLPRYSTWRAATHSGLFPWGNSKASCSYAVYFDRAPSCTGLLRPQVVCSHPRGNTENGACDLSGNLWEWVKPNRSTSTETALIVGGAWSSAAIDLKSSSKREKLKATRDPSIGIRLVYSHYVGR